MTDISPYPYQSLPQFTSQEVQLKHKLLNTYYFFQSQTDTLAFLLEPLKEILKTDVKVKVTHIESAQLNDVMNACSDRSLLGAVHLEPHGKKVVLVFETLLAKILVHKLLSGSDVTTDKVVQLQLKPLTVLEEAVVEYLLVAMLEKYKAKDLSVAYECVLRDSNKLMGLLSNQDVFAVISIQLTLYKKDFFIKLVLPLHVADDLGLSSRDEYFIAKRMREFHHFKTTFQLEVGEVTLNQTEIGQLVEGDIVLFDEVSLEATGHPFHGKAKMRLTDSTSDAGYMVAVESQKDSIQATIESIL